MYIEQKRSKDWFKKGFYIGLTLLFVSMGHGCASTEKTTRTDTVVTYPAVVAVNEGGQGGVTTVVTSPDQQNISVVEKSETTTTTSETSADHPGIISSTFHAIGYVLVLPFIIVGGVFRMIFGG